MKLAPAIGAAVPAGLLLAAVTVGLVTGAVVMSVASSEGSLQVRTEQPASVAELEDAHDLGDPLRPQRLRR
jgi:hypothetical protein